MTLPMTAHLSTVHARSDVRIFEKMACSLAAAGFDVHLVVTDGRGDDQVRGVSIHDIGKLGTSRFKRMVLQGVRMWRAARALRADLYHFHDPELIWVGLALRLTGAQVIYDSHEDVPRDILSKEWIAPSLRRAVAWLFERFEGLAVKRFSAVISPTPHIQRRFARLCRTSVCIANYPSIGELDGASAHVARERAVCYVGSVARNRGALEMVQAVACLPDLTLLLCGTFEDEQLRQQLEREPGWAQVEYLGYVDRQGVAAVMARSRVGLVILHPIISYVDAWPIKMFEYMSAALPVLASDFPLWRGVLIDEGAGVCVDPLNPARIAAALQEFLDQPERAKAMGERGRSAVLARYRWDCEAKKLVSLYKQLLGEQTGIAQRGS